MSGAGPDDAGVLFAEAGAPWWPLLIGPAVGVGGVLLDRLAPGGATPWAWVVIGLVLLLPIALIVRARRRLLRVRVTPEVLVQGDEAVPIARIAGIRPADGSGRYGIRPFGDHPTVPRHVGVIVVTLEDGTRRAAWARDADGLHAALGRVLAQRSPTRAEGA
ncbi:MAG TPA: hypothetical protein VGH76_19615 [Actinomycetospora sp.]|jgi:hypothetical protein|uniref:hypothetical protein n=1 Tax=Actinomycetospora sp. TaxID=1872135 RepID=UPI002F3F09D8